MNAKSDLEQLRDYISQKMDEANVFTTEEMQTSNPTSLSSHIVYDAYKQPDSKHFADLGIAVEVNARKPVMDVKVGKRPNGVGRGIIEDFNTIFTAMFKHFEDHERIVTVWQNSHSEDPLGRFGSLSVAGVRRWSKYYQLVIVGKEREEYTEEHDSCFGKFEEPEKREYPMRTMACSRKYYCHEKELCKQKTTNADYEEPVKTRNITIIKPTKRGRLAYENGQVIEVDWGNTPVKIGIGQPYPVDIENKIFKQVYEIWNKKKIAQSRQGDWYSELRAFFLENLLAEYTGEAIAKTVNWANEKADDWNREHPKRRKGIKHFTILPENQEKLALWCSV